MNKKINFIFTVLVCIGIVPGLHASLSSLNLKEEQMKDALKRLKELGCQANLRAGNCPKDSTVSAGSSQNEYLDAWLNDTQYYDQAYLGRDGLLDKCMKHYGHIPFYVENAVNFYQKVKKEGMTVGQVFRKFEQEQKVREIVLSKIPAPVLVTPVLVTKAKTKEEEYEIALKVLEESKELQEYAVLLAQSRK